MKPVTWFVGGAIGGLIGGAIWVAVGHFANYEVGWIAWGIGALVGIGVRVAAGEDEGWLPGASAVTVAVGSIALAKYIVVSLAVSGLADGFSIDFTDQDMIAINADQIVDELVAKEKLDWPPEDLDENLPLPQQYPPKVWAEAKKKWESLPPDQQKSKVEEQKVAAAEFVESFEELIREEAFSESFTAWDLLWFGLAAFTAFKLGSGMITEE